MVKTSRCGNKDVIDEDEDMPRSLFDHCWLVILWEQRCYRWGWRYAQVGIWISYGNLLVAFIKQDFWTFCRQRVIASRGGRSKRLTIKINIFCLLCEFLGQESGPHNVNCIYCRGAFYIWVFSGTLCRDQDGRQKTWPTRSQNIPKVGTVGYLILSLFWQYLFPHCHHFIFIRFQRSLKEGCWRDDCKSFQGDTG